MSTLSREKGKTVSTVIVPVDAEWSAADIRTRFKDNLKTKREPPRPSWPNEGSERGFGKRGIEIRQRDDDERYTERLHIAGYHIPIKQNVMPDSDIKFVNHDSLYYKVIVVRICKDIFSTWWGTQILQQQYKCWMTGCRYKKSNNLA